MLGSILDFQIQEWSGDNALIIAANMRHEAHLMHINIFNKSTLIKVAKICITLDTAAAVNKC